jgi:ribosomal protein L9
MKNVFKTTLAVIVMAIATPSFSTPFETPGESAQPMDAAEMKKLENRLEEIGNMDVRSMSKSEKKAIRKEVKAIKKKMDTSGGVYLSVGAIILIVVLLILLL